MILGDDVFFFVRRRGSHMKPGDLVGPGILLRCGTSKLTTEHWSAGRARAEKCLLKIIVIECITILYIIKVYMTLLSIDDIK